MAVRNGSKTLKTDQRGSGSVGEKGVRENIWRGEGK